MTFEKLVECRAGKSRLHSGSDPQHILGILSYLRSPVLQNTLIWLP